MRLELRPQAFTASVSGTRTLTGGGVYAYLNGTAGRFTPGVSTGDAGPEKDEITLRAGSVDLSSRSAYNRKLIAGAVYASAVERLRHHGTATHSGHSLPASSLRVGRSISRRRSHGR